MVGDGSTDAAMIKAVSAQEAQVNNDVQCES